MHPNKRTLPLGTKGLRSRHNCAHALISRVSSCHSIHPWHSPSDVDVVVGVHKPSGSTDRYRRLALCQHGIGYAEAD